VHVEVHVDELVGHVADDHHPRLGRLLDARREVGHHPDDRVALRDAEPGPEVADHDAPGVDADAHLGGPSEAALQVGPGVAHRDDEVEPGEHGSARVVLVGFRVAERGEDAVPRELDDVAAVAGHRLPSELAVGGEQVAQLFGLDALGEHRRPHDVGEEQRHQGALPQGPGRLRGDALEDHRGSPVVGVDRAHLLGRGTSRLQVAGLQ
jgi:hypothetical protein